MSSNESDRRISDYSSSWRRRKVEYACALLRMVLDSMADVDSISLDAAIDGAAHAKRLKGLAWRLQDQFDEAIIAEMIHSGTDTAVTKRATVALLDGKKYRSWKDDDLYGAIIATETDKIISESRSQLPRAEVHHIVTSTIGALRRLARQTWRVRALRQEGLDPARYSTEEHRPMSVSITLRPGGEPTHVRAPALSARTSTRAALWA